LDDCRDVFVDNVSTNDISCRVVKASARTPVFDLTPIAFEVLLSLMDGPQHGYGIKLDIEARTDGEISLGSGTLYQAIQRLERAGLIGEARSAERVDARRGRSYRLLPAGRAAVHEHLRRLSRVGARNLLPAKS
jgi:DNA-binding PadR family transcriptional regulator